MHVSATLQNSRDDSFTVRASPMDFPGASVSVHVARAPADKTFIDLYIPR